MHLLRILRRVLQQINQARVVLDGQFAWHIAEASLLSRDRRDVRSVGEHRTGGDAK